MTNSLETLIDLVSKLKLKNEALEAKIVRLEIEAEHHKKMIFDTPGKALFIDKDDVQELETMEKLKEIREMLSMIYARVQQ